MLLYRFLKYWIKPGYKVYFRKIFIRGMEHVDEQKPILFAVNHPSAFLEPTLIATSVDFDVHFMTRGDLFNPRFLWFFNATNQVPVFRFKDGFSQLKSNRDSFSECHKRLINGARLLIFCEGSMKWVKKLRTVQPGAAKLAFGTLEKKEDLPLVIHPIGLSYDDHSRFRSDLMMEIGPAIEPGDYFEEYRTEPRKAVKKLTAEIQKQLSQCVLHIERDEDLEIGALLWTVVKNDREFFGNKGGSPFQEVKNALDRFNESAESKSGILLRDKLSEYDRTLKNHKLEDGTVGKLSKNGLSVLSAGIFSLLLLPFSLFYLLPLWLATVISRNTMANVEFYSSVRAVLFIFLLTVLLLAILLALWFSPYSVFWILILSLGVWIDLRLRPNRHHLFGFLRAGGSWKPVRKLAKLRGEILEIIKTI